MLEIGRTFDAYMRSVSPFQYKNTICRLIDNYVASPYIRCAICGEYPLFEVSVIESDGGERLRVGNNCIDRVTGQSVSESFRSLRRKRESIMANRTYIDRLSLILIAHENNTLSFQITNGDVEKLRMMLVQMCNGLNLTINQEQLAECYIRRKATA